MEGRPVRAIILRERPRVLKPGGAEFQPPSPETHDLVRNQLRLREGSPYRQREASEDISRLNRLGPFKSVESRVQQLDDGSVNLIYTFILQPVITSVQVVGNQLLSDQEITEVSSVLVNTPVDATQIDRYARLIEARYREQGYHNCNVSVDQAELEKTGVLIYRVREGERTKIRDISFRGNLSFPRFELLREIKSEPAELVFTKGLLDEALIAQDVSALVQFYKDRGYLDVRVDREIILSPNSREALVTFLIDEGPVYTLRSVKAEFPQTVNPILSPEQLLGLMTIKPGDIYGESALRKSLRSIQDAYLKMGYVDAQVERRELRDPSLPLVDILILVGQGERFRTGEVIIAGNDLTRQNVVRRQTLDLRPDRPLDGTAIERTKSRVRATRLFNDQPPGGVRVTIQPPDELEPDHRDVLIEVEETNTGEFGIGGFINSDGGITGRISITQRNFDLADPPATLSELLTNRAFRGGGQTFTMEILPGDRAQTFRLGLVEPSLFETNFSGSISGFARRRVYREYTENRFGANLGLGRRFGSRWEGRMPLRFETIGLNEIDADAPTDYYAVEDYNLLTSLGVELDRSTLDNQIRPSKGAVINLSAAHAGVLGGDFNFTSLSAHHKLFIPLSEDVLGRNTLLIFQTRARYIPQGMDNTPFYERFTLGGQDLRGFDFRGISPRGIRNDTLTQGVAPIGGTFAFFWGAEIQQPLYEDLLAGVIFVDTGTVQETLNFADYRASVGFGVRLNLPFAQVPFAFDFGFPILKDETDDLRLFTFQVDIPFR